MASVIGTLNVDRPFITRSLALPLAVGSRLSSPISVVCVPSALLQTSSVYSPPATSV